MIAQVLIGLAGALAAEYALVIITSVVSGPDHLYGGPIPVGESRATVLYGDPAATFFPGLFALDVLVTGAVLVLIGRWAGAIGTLLASLAMVASLVAAIAMAVVGLPLAGLPIPAFRGQPLPPFLFLWIDMVLWAVGAGALVTRTRRGVGRASSLSGGSAQTKGRSRDRMGRPPTG